MMQNQPIPKLSVTEVIYSRLVWVYNLTFVLTIEKQIPQNCHMYTCTQDRSGRYVRDLAPQNCNQKIIFSVISPEHLNS